MASEGSQRLEEALKLMAEAIKLKLAEMEPSSGVASASASAEGTDTLGEISVDAQEETASVRALTVLQRVENFRKNLYPRWRIGIGRDEWESIVFLCDGPEYLTGNLLSLLPDDCKRVYAALGGGTGLHWAVRMEDVALVIRILEELKVDEVDVNAKDLWWEATGLHWAVRTGNVAIVEAMCTHHSLRKFDLGVKDKRGYTAPQCAMLKSNVPMVKALLGFGPDKRPDWTGVLEDVNHVVLQGGSMEVLQHYFDSHRETWFTSIQSMFSFDNYVRDTSCLHWAVKMEDTTLASHILTEGKVDVNAEDKHGYTPLHVAVLSKDLDIVKIMVAKHLELGNFNVNFVEHGTGYTGLHYAILHGKEENIEMVRELLKCKETMRLTEECKGGETPLQIADERGFKDIQKRLLECDRVQCFVDDLYRDRQVYVDAANAILVGAALIASWLQPPLGYGTLGWVDLKHSQELRAFWIFNCLSFYFAIGTVVFGARSVLPRSPYFIKVTVKKLWKNLLVTAFLLACLVFFVVIAFAIAGCLVLASTFSVIQLYMIIPSIIGGLVCLVGLVFLAKSMWQDSSLGKNTAIVKAEEWETTSLVKAEEWESIASKIRVYDE